MASAPHPKTPAAGYGMLPVPEALDIVLKHTTTMPSETISIADAFGRVLAHDVHAQEPVPPFPASIKVGGGLSMIGVPYGCVYTHLCHASQNIHWSTSFHTHHPLLLPAHARKPCTQTHPSSTHIIHTRHPHTHTQDGYAVCSADGPGEYAVAFEAYAGSAPPALQRGTVAYIGTGSVMCVGLYDIV